MLLFSTLCTNHLIKNWNIFQRLSSVKDSTMSGGSATYFSRVYKVAMLEPLKAWCQNYLQWHSLLIKFHENQANDSEVVRGDKR